MALLQTCQPPSYWNAGNLRSSIGLITDLEKRIPPILNSHKMGHAF